MVAPLRRAMPRMGGRKLYHLLRPSLAVSGVGRDRFFDILRANHMLVMPKRSYHVTTNSRHMFRKYRNLVMQRVPTGPEQVWVADITYIGGRDRHAYLALVTDAYSKKIMGYDLSDSLGASGAVRALRMADRGRMYRGNTLIHHSDRGIQYCCDEYQLAARRCRLTISMTEGYDPYANAVAERVNGILKQEFALEDLDLPLAIQRKIVAESIEIYNTMRPHSSCSMLTPSQMHLQSEVKIKTYRKNWRSQRASPVK
jgi:transposase InsO family protein